MQPYKSRTEEKLQKESVISNGLLFMTFVTSLTHIIHMFWLEGEC